MRKITVGVVAALALFTGSSLAAIASDPAEVFCGFDEQDGTHAIYVNKQRPIGLLVKGTHRLPGSDCPPPMPAYD